MFETGGQKNLAPMPGLFKLATMHRYHSSSTDLRVAHGFLFGIFASWLVLEFPRAVLYNDINSPAGQQGEPSSISASP
jgi:hypothetical protein